MEEKIKFTIGSSESTSGKSSQSSKNAVQHKKDGRDGIGAIMAILLVVLLLSSLVSVYYLNSATAQITNEINDMKENQRPAVLQLTEIVDSSCKECFDIGRITSALTNLKGTANITGTRSVEFSSTEGKQLVAQYSLDKIPAVLIKGEINKTNVASLWQNAGGRSVKDSIVIEAVPPYKEVSTGQTRGLVDFIMLTDKSCSNCYNVTNHKQILAQFGVFIKSENTFDVNSTQGQTLVNQYNITKVPTMLLSPEASAYLTLKQVWVQVGTIEKDGWFVFRAAEAMGNFTTV